MTFDDKIKKFAELFQSDTDVRFMKSNMNSLIGDGLHMVKVKPGQKYYKVDLGHSGRFMIEIETGNIYGIKAYGQVHKGHMYGTLDTMDDWFWGDYTPMKRSVMKQQKERLQVYAQKREDNDIESLIAVGKRG